MKKLFLIGIVIITLIGCNTTFKTVNIVSFQKDIIDSCNNYIENVPLNLQYWNTEPREHGAAYYVIVPIYHKRKQDIIVGYHTITSKPYYYISGIDSVVNGQKIYFTIIKYDGILK